MRLFLPRVRIAAWRCAALASLSATIACATPPQKEIDQARATIEVAVAAGADQFAPAELASARTAYAQAQDSVAQREYKLALGHALDSRERALGASRAAAATKTRLEGETKRALTDVAEQMARLEGALAAPPPRPLRAQAREARATHTRLQGMLQKARAAADAGDYLVAGELLTGIRRDLEALLPVWAPSASAQSSRTKT